MRTRKFQWTAILFASFGLFHTIIACNKNDSGGGGGPAPVPVYPGYNPNCPTCNLNGMMGMGGAPLLTNVKSATASERVLIGLDVLASGPSMANPADPKAAVSYSGPVAIRGTLRVTDPNDSMFCFAAPGDYSIQTVEMIQMSGLMLSGGRLVAQGISGQGQIVMRIYSAQFYNPTETVWSQSQNNRVGLNVMVDSVNGRPCGSVSTY